MTAIRLMEGLEQQGKETTAPMQVILMALEAAVQEKLRQTKMAVMDLNRQSMEVRHSMLVADQQAKGQQVLRVNPVSEVAERLLAAT